MAAVLIGSTKWIQQIAQLLQLNFVLKFFGPLQPVLYTQSLGVKHSSKLAKKLKSKVWWANLRDFKQVKILTSGRKPVLHIKFIY